MSNRRPSLPGAAELFRVTGTPDPADRPVRSRRVEDRETPIDGTSAPVGLAAVPAPATDFDQARRYSRRRSSSGRPSGRQRHDEKITVYCSAEELLDLESARLALRAEHGLVVDRGRIVREAVAVLLADLDAKGDHSILVRRLRES